METTKHTPDEIIIGLRSAAAISAALNGEKLAGDTLEEQAAEEILRLKALLKRAGEALREMDNELFNHAFDDDSPIRRFARILSTDIQKEGL